MAALKEGDVCSIVLRNVWSTINCLADSHKELTISLRAKLLQLANEHMTVTYRNDQGVVLVKDNFEAPNFLAIFDAVTVFVLDCYAKHGLGTITTKVLNVPITRIMKIEDGALRFPNCKDKYRYGEAYDELYDYLKVDRPPSDFDRRHFYRSVFDMYHMWNHDVDKSTDIVIGCTVTHKSQDEQGRTVLTKEDIGNVAYTETSVRQALQKINALLNSSWLLGHMDNIAGFMFTINVKDHRKVWHHVFKVGDPTTRELWVSRAVCELL